MRVLSDAHLLRETRQKPYCNAARLSRACDNRAFSYSPRDFALAFTASLAKDRPILFCDGIDVGNGEDIMLSEVECRECDKLSGGNSPRDVE